jgi:hypothetical protein
MMHLQTRFAYNAAENQRLYVMCGLKKSPKVTMRQFCERVATLNLNDAIEYLSMRYYSPKATEHTIKTEKYDDMTMVGNIMRALPESWQNDLLKSVQGVTPETTRELLPLLELVERSPPSGAMPPIPKKEKPADVSHSGGKRRGGKLSGGSDKRQKGNLNLNRCKHCDKHGGPSHTHTTEKCFKYNLDGTPKSSFVTKEKKAHKAFASLQAKLDKSEKKLNKLIKHKSKKEKKRSRRARYESSDSDSDSS